MTISICSAGYRGNYFLKINRKYPFWEILFFCENCIVVFRKSRSSNSKYESMSNRFFFCGVCTFYENWNKRTKTLQVKYILYLLCYFRRGIFLNSFNVLCLIYVNMNNKESLKKVNTQTDA